MLSPEILGKLRDYAKSKGWSTDDDSIIEIITESDVIWSDSTIDHHRWYSLQTVVVNPINDVYIEFDKYIITGDMSLDDMGLHYSLDDFVEVVPKEVTTKIIVYNKK